MENKPAGATEEAYEELISGLIEKGFGSTDRLLSSSLVSRLRKNLHYRHARGQMHPAGIGKRFSYTRNLKVRGDLISWIDDCSDDSAENEFISIIKDFTNYLNETCYAGINAFEFHFSLYSEGSFYLRHLDQFKADQGRKYSLVTYLNEDWTESDGGQLILYTDSGNHSILPVGGRTVFFSSQDLEHEVMTAGRDRLSIAGWLKSI